jgi:hypothetical protein
VRHAQVEQHEIEIACLPGVERLARVGTAGDMGETGFVEDRFEQGDVGGVVVDDQDLGFGERLVGQDHALGSRVGGSACDGAVIRFSCRSGRGCRRCARWASVVGGLVTVRPRRQRPAG